VIEKCSKILDRLEFGNFRSPARNKVIEKCSKILDRLEFGNFRSPARNKAYT